MAPFTLRMMASFFSRNTARRRRIVSRIPPASPAATMLTKRSVNAFLCFDNASASVLPDSTSYTTCFVTSASALLSVCRAKISRACTSGSPALIIVANCRVKITTSRVGTFVLRFAFFASRTRTTRSRFWRRWAMTSSLVGRSMVAVCSSPPTV